MATFVERLHARSSACARAVSRRLRSEAGFGLIEVLIAMVVLAIGVIGLVSMMDGARASSNTNKTREGATNLAREVVEAVNSLPYTQVVPSSIESTLQAKPGLSSTTAAPNWTVSRRGISYTVSATTCYVDDPKDGSGSHAADFCSSATGSSDSQPIDYKKTTVDVSWKSGPGQSHVRQTTLSMPGGNSDAPAVTNLVGTPASPITSTANTSVAFTATTAGPASGVEWFVNDNPQGLATGSGNSWQFTWPIGGLSDGTYVISARAYDSSGAYGPPYQISYTLNRNAPPATSGFNAGWNPVDSSVDSEWLASNERDVVGYHVYRQQLAPVSGSATLVNCGTTGSPVYLVTQLSCTDASPIALPATTVGNSTFASGSSTSTLAINAPAGLQSGDVLIATINAGGIPTISAPAGWVQIRSNAGGTLVTQNTFYKVATAAEPASYSFTFSSNKNVSGGITAYRTVDTTTPVDDSSGSTATGSGNAVDGGVTTTRLNDRVIATASFAGPAGTWVPTSPAGTTQEYHANSSATMTTAANTAQAYPGATGSFSTTPGGTPNAWVAQTIALKPKTLKVNYWVVPVDYDAAGNLREGAASNAVDAYAVNTPPSPPTWSATPVTALSDGTTQLQWNVSPGDPDSGDSVAYYRIYRDGQRYDTTGSGTDTTYIDTNPGGTTHTYTLRAVDTHMAESSAPTGVTG